MQNSSYGAPPDPDCDLPLEVLRALTVRDFKRAMALLDEGADGNALVDATGSRREWVTPAAYALSQMQLDILPALLGTGHTAVPVGRRLQDGSSTTIWDELALAADDDTFSVEPACTALKSCFDCEMAEVAHSMWNAAERALSSYSPDQLPRAERIDCAKSLLRAGAYPKDNEAWTEVLGRVIEYEGGTPGAPGIPFIRYFGDGDSQTHLEWIKHGLGIDAPIRGMPPIHHAVVGNNEDVLAVYLGAGADIGATCTFDAFTRNAGTFGSLKYVPAAEITAYDIAREFILPGCTQMLEAAAAKARIDAVVSASRKGQTP